MAKQFSQAQPGFPVAWFPSLPWKGFGFIGGMVRCWLMQMLCSSRDGFFKRIPRKVEMLTFFSLNAIKDTYCIPAVSLQITGKKC